ncbi:MAG: hypothetical protein LBL62_12755 [Planctomycetaceae bacterium]|nr:hypothetical protein [Planctomycetaceae bacterium]
MLSSESLYADATVLGSEFSLFTPPPPPYLSSPFYHQSQSGQRVELPKTEPLGTLQYRFGNGEAELAILTRAYYRNDQRIQWSGGETVFGVESVLSPKIKLNLQPSTLQLNGEFYLNQPYDKNIYLNNSERQSYSANYKIDSFEISQLYMSWKWRNIEFRAGKFETPFGHCFVPLMSNSKMDAPFIRTESILWRQTGFQLRWTPSVWEIDIAAVNGCTGLDTNSMKAVVGRIGMNFGCFQWGVSGLYQDGIGSEEMKEYKNHAGFDVAVRFGNWTLSAEGIYDEYGLRRSFNPADIFWEKSIYYRQINKADGVPIIGFGYYIDLNYRQGAFLFDLNYGEFYPEQLNRQDYPQHDFVNRRLLTKIGWNFNQFLQWYGAIIIENDNYIAQEGRPRRGLYFLSGIKFEF